MPMRVLRNGDPAMARPVVRFRCKNCDCLFEAKGGKPEGLPVRQRRTATAQSEIETRHRWHEYTIETDRKRGYYYRARCPCCGEFVAGGELAEKEKQKKEGKLTWKSFGSE